MQNSVRYPAEWEEQAATWLALPINEANWAGRRERIDAFYSKLIDAISKFQPVKILDNLQIPHNDIWIRDYGPFFVEHAGKLSSVNVGKLSAVSYEFNAWGEKFPPWDLDNAAPENIAENLGIDCKKYKWILEGGAMEFNGEGLCLTTAPCLFGAKRNPPERQDELFKDLKESLGITSLKILPKGLDGDHTDGHIDNFARFVAKNRVVMAAGFENIQRDVEKWLGEHYENAKVDVLPLPPQKTLNGEILPASYMNFIFANGALIMPLYNCDKDSLALDYFKNAFPDREVLGLDCSAPIEEGGRLHCLSKQMPG